MNDRVERIGHSTIQHGKDSNRVYLMEYSPKDQATLAQDLIEFAKQKGYTKIFAKTPASQASVFMEEGYEVEATIENYCQGKTDYVFLAKYFDENRKHPENLQEIDKVIATAKKKENLLALPKLSDKMQVRKLTPGDKEQLARLYRAVFETYPFPIHQEEYLVETMEDQVTYFGIFENDTLIAASSAEKNAACKNAEMTDFAILPEYRGENFASLLLDEMEKEMKRIGYKTLYTIARAVSYGMNATFSKAGYRFSGTLYSNTQISGSLESMNVWYKNIKGE
ncbi:MAG TPA: putative beta-lysine N-acetyltransferase [Eubacteriaceae bacterium]|nr:putative beta-lysine N-acetyltransferase [Eubacteriaceae bacterium]